MTKIFTLFITLIISLAVSGQIKKSSNLLGGEIYYSQSDINRISEDLDFKTAVITILYGRTIKENLVLGLHLGITPLSRFKSTSGVGTYETKTSGFSISPYIRKYRSLGENFFVFGQFDAHYGMSFIETDNINSPDSDLRSWNVGIGIAPGFSYQLFRRFHLQLTIPDIFKIEYGEAIEEYNMPNIEDETSKGFTMGTRLTNLSQLGYLNFGFYFVL